MFQYIQYNCVCVYVGWGRDGNNVFQCIQYNCVCWGGGEGVTMCFSICSIITCVCLGVGGG